MNVHFLIFSLFVLAIFLVYITFYNYDYYFLTYEIVDMNEPMTFALYLHYL